MEDRHIIWSNENLDLDDWREDLQEQYPDCSEDELYRIMCETNADYLSDERVKLNIQLNSNRAGQTGAYQTGFCGLDLGRP